MRGDGGAADVELLVFHSLGKVHHDINEYQLRLDVQRFLWPVYYITYLFIYLRGSYLSHLGM